MIINRIKKKYGQALVEYALITAFISLVLVAASSGLFDGIRWNFWVGLQTTNIGKVNMPDAPNSSGSVTTNKPVAIISGPDYIHQGNPITLTDNSYVRTGRIVRTSWGTKTLTKTYNQEGLVTVTLTVWDNNGNSDTATKTITVGNQAPEASISIKSIVPYLGTHKDVTFSAMVTDKDSDRIDMYEWTLSNYDLSDWETQGTLRLLPGTYTIKLRARDHLGKWSETYSKTFTIDSNKKPVAVINVESSYGVIAEGADIEISAYDSYDPDGDKITKYIWTFDGISMPNWGVYVDYENIKMGSHTVTLQVQDSFGLLSDVKTYKFYAQGNTPPIAVIKFNYTGTVITDKTTVSMNGLFSYDPNGDSIIGYRWGGDYKESGVFPVGTYSVTLQVKDSRGAWSKVVTQTFTVIKNRPPDSPVCTRTPEGGITTTTKVTIKCTATDPDGDIVTLNYSQPLKDYYPAGKVEISVTASDRYGNVSKPTAMVFYVITPSGSGGVELTGPNTTLIENVPEGATAKSFTFSVPSVMGHSGDDYALVRGYNKFTNTWVNVYYQEVSNGIYVNAKVTEGLYTKIQFFYYASHCMYGKSNITYSVDYSY